MRTSRHGWCLPLIVFLIVLLVVGLGYAFWGGLLVHRSNQDNSLAPFFSEQQHYQEVKAERPVVLPQDFSFHPAFQNEWWTLMANVTDSDGHRYGIQWTYMRLAHDDVESISWEHPQLYLAQVAVSDKHHVWKSQRLSRGGIGQAGLSLKPFHLWLDNWDWHGMTESPLPGVLAVDTDEVSFRLSMAAQTPFVLPGQQGYKSLNRDGPVALYAIDMPRIEMTGSLRLRGVNKPISVSGIAWLSKRWGNDFVMQKNRNWDWMVFHLQGGTELSVTRYRQSNQMPFDGGVLTLPNGEVHNLGPDELMIVPQLVATTDNGHEIPSQWHIQVPAYGIDLTATTINKDLWLPFIVPYWQEPVNVSGSHSAVGFMQLTGY